VLHFEIYIDDETREMTVIQIHPDEESLMLHMQLAGDRVARAYEFLDTVIVRMFGSPSDSFKETAMGGGVGRPSRRCCHCRLGARDPRLVGPVATTPTTSSKSTRTSRPGPGSAR
jgi:hypothetical protein